MPSERFHVCDWNASAFGIGTLLHLQLKRIHVCDRSAFVFARGVVLRILGSKRVRVQRLATATISGSFAIGIISARGGESVATSRSRCYVRTATLDEQREAAFSADLHLAVYKSERHSIFSLVLLNFYRSLNPPLILSLFSLDFWSSFSEKMLETAQCAWAAYLPTLLCS